MGILTLQLDRCLREDKMKFTILFIIFSMFSTIFDGGELCFSHDGDVHLSCCCKNKEEASLKKPCCGSHCIDISFPSVDVAVNQVRESEQIHFEIDHDIVTYHQTVSTLSTNTKINLSYDNHRLSGVRSHISLKLSKTVFRC